MPAEDIGYIRLNKFAATTHQEFVTALQQLKSQGMEKLDPRPSGGIPADSWMQPSILPMSFLSHSS
jgi:hypothetical protein